MNCKHPSVKWEPLNIAEAMAVSDTTKPPANGGIPEVIAAFGVCNICHQEVSLDYVPTHPKSRKG